MKGRVVLYCLLALAAALPARADTLDFSFNDASADVQYAWIFVKSDYVYAEGGAVKGAGREVLGRLSGRFVYNDDEDTRIGALGADVLGHFPGAPGLDLGVGLRFFGGVTDEDQDIFAAGIGVTATYAPAFFHGVVLDGHFSYAPRVFCALDADRFWEGGFMAGYTVMPQAVVFAGYNAMSANFEDFGQRKIDEEVRVGVRLRF
ncbi:hypothetical protein G3N55_05035 [Dissulfurirhabdus thermomarina]|uniref:Porin family protein n=1 Tax=Dissulfurirhabdus thermomarina TaxID=1765737 RepID=A0A6N9TM62_DISTH|nr:hypothetical protein [Dissulfurirhabdus thermomarina]NDY42209.1 hypothetical protein [Dissulfurirhabdus thermomarina]NMX22663.1 hypothetical protein [Dissulfurirhabdus thermomarina]